jgi:hypothetical protein
MQVQATRHFREGFSLLAAYTFSKAIALTSSSIDAEGVADQFNRGLERSITSFHLPHVFKATWIYELPVGPGKFVNVPGVVGKIIGGWQLTGNHQIRSGSPLSIGTGGIVNPFGTARADYVSGQDLVSNSDAGINFRGITGGQAYLNRAAFANPPVHPGGRNVVTRLGTLGERLPNTRNRHYHMEDLGIQKLFRVDEHRTFEIRGVFQNPFNRVGRGGLITDITNPFFGQYTNAQHGGRNIELSARITF